MTTYREADMIELHDAGIAIEIYDYNPKLRSRSDLTIFTAKKMRININNPKLIHIRFTYIEEENQELEFTYSGTYTIWWSKPAKKQKALVSVIP